MTKKRDYTKFFTHQEMAKFMAALLDPQPDQVILEPSAGSGNLVKAVKEKCPQAHVFACEIDEQWRESLSALTRVVVIKDFLEYPTWPRHSACIANPPFGNGTDLRAHFNRMREAVKKGGKMVVLVPADFDPMVEHNAYAFANWAKNSDGTTTEIKVIEFFN